MRWTNVSPKNRHYRHDIGWIPPSCRHGMMAVHESGRYGAPMQSFFKLLATGIVAILLVACRTGTSSSTPADEAEGGVRYGQLRFHPCTLSGPYSGGNVSAQCARLDVPENRDAPEGRHISLHIAWLPATSDGAETEDPVFFLAGGPGQAASSSWPTIDAAFANVRRQRHVILVDQRGTGLSHPLGCGDTSEDANAETGGDTFEQVIAATKRCAAQLDADPRHYTTTDAVADLDQVRAALGAATINLVGVSYGTRVVQQYAMRHPQRVRTMTLDGIVPNTLILGSEDARNLDRALGLQFLFCEQTPSCKEAFGDDLRGQLRTLMTRLSEHPVDAKFRDPNTGELRHDTVTTEHIIVLTRMFSYVPQAAALLPLVLREADRDRYDPLLALSSMIEQQMNDQIVLGMQLSVICAEDADQLKEDPAADRYVIGNQTIRLLKAQCSVWPAGERPADFHTPLVADIPALLLSGELDPVTPPDYGDQVAAHLSQGRHLVLQWQGHGSFNTGCVPRLLGQFLETADARALDASCLDSLSYVPPFITFNGWDP
ncbi:MAG: alpha/beta hydrolase [Xanthomonadaceae bacterium]|jgi:pimeloyl-ACP methyl ester carboxylesterase|nr:alpha/beta hydrolase [Xanthomonadaceae bacterium]